MLCEDTVYRKKEECSEFEMDLYFESPLKEKCLLWYTPLLICIFKAARIQI
jgi:hypothetical protein